MSRFRDVPLAPPDQIFGISRAFAADNRPQKVNLGVGVYRTADGRVPLLEVVRAAESELAESGLSRNYLPIDGDAEYVEATMRLALGSDAPHICGAQTVGATGALRIAGDLLRTQLGARAIYMPSPTWANHRSIFTAAGLEVHSYPYYNFQEQRLELEQLLEALETMPEGAAVLLHTVCHNPTGVDPTEEEWRQILERVERRSLLPIFDCAYQGFASGLEEDRRPIELFLQVGVPLAVCYSYSKNLALYAERLGALFWACDSADEAERMGSQMRAVARASYSNPPFHGPAVAKRVLGSMYEPWNVELGNMRDRIHEMRSAFLATLQAKIPERDFNFLRRQQGLFSFVGLEKEQAERLTRDFAIFLPNSGRINVTGLNTENLPYVVEAIAAVMG